tara:strand:- start:225 stop:434 length:210 start_codon:yes stop_codon:yes gene_type:complete
MEQVTNSIGYPITLLIERVYWLGLGGFLGLAIITSVIRTLKQRKTKSTNVSANQLKKLAKKATQKNTNN